MDIYGIIVDVDLSKYEGLTSKQTAKAILIENGFQESPIDARLDRYMEDLPYSYYNVAWSDKIETEEGAKGLLEELRRREIKVGIATGEAERVSKMRLQKASLDEYFIFGAYGEANMEMAEIIKKAAENAKEQFGNAAEWGILVSSLPGVIRAGKAAGIRTVGVVNGKTTVEKLKKAGANTIVKSLKDKSAIIKELDIASK